MIIITIMDSIIEDIDTIIMDTITETIIDLETMHKETIIIITGHQEQAL